MSGKIVVGAKEEALRDPAGKMIYAEVLDVLQQADELGGVDINSPEEYIKLMTNIAVECMERAHACASNMKDLLTVQKPAVVITMEAYKTFLDLSETTTMDIETGIEEGIYLAEDNPDIEKYSQFVKDADEHLLHVTYVKRKTVEVGHA